MTPQERIISQFKQEMFCVARYRPAPSRLHELAERIAKKHGVTSTVLRGRAYRIKLSQARRELAREATKLGLSPKVIGHFMGRDRGTIFYFLRDAA